MRRLLASAIPAALVLTALILVGQSAGITLALRRFFAAAAGWVLALFGADVMVRGTEIASPAFSISVVTACTGLFVTGLFLTAVAAFPSSWRARLIGAALGVLGLSVLNIVRLVTLFCIGVRWPGMLDVAHQLVWQSVVIVAAVALWFVWAGRVTARGARA